jgi:hypothetical protein
MGVNFYDFLEESLDYQGRTAKFARLVFTDIDNGCGSNKFDALAWKAHFIEKHKSPELVDMLLLAFVEYYHAKRTKL